MFKIFLKRRLVSEPSSPSTTAREAAYNRRQAERVDVSEASILALNDSDILQVDDISRSGFATTVSERAFERFTLEDSFEARLRYLRQNYDLTLKVVWKKNSRVGFQLIDPCNETRALFNRIVEPRALGISLKPVDAEFLASAPGKSWYHGDESTDLFIWRSDNDEIVAWQLSFQAKLVEWSSASGYKTGEIQKGGPSEAGLAIPSDEVQKYDEHLDLTKIEVAADLFSAIKQPFVTDVIETLSEVPWDSASEKDT